DLLTAATSGTLPKWAKEPETVEELSSAAPTVNVEKQAFSRPPPRQDRPGMRSSPKRPPVHPGGQRPPPVPKNNFTIPILIGVGVAGIMLLMLVGGKFMNWTKKDAVKETSTPAPKIDETTPDPQKTATHITAPATIPAPTIIP